MRLQSIAIVVYSLSMFFCRGQAEPSGSTQPELTDKNRVIYLAIVSEQINRIGKDLHEIQLSRARINASNDDPSEWVEAYTASIVDAKKKIVDLNRSGFLTDNEEDRSRIKADIKRWEDAVKWMVETREFYRNLELETEHLLRNEERLRLFQKTLLKTLSDDERTELFDKNKADDSRTGGKPAPDPTTQSAVPTPTIPIAPPSRQE